MLSAFRRAERRVRASSVEKDSRKIPRGVFEEEDREGILHHNGTTGQRDDAPLEKAPPPRAAQHHSPRGPAATLPSLARRRCSPSRQRRVRVPRASVGVRAAPGSVSVLRLRSRLRGQPSLVLCQLHVRARESSSAPDRVPPPAIARRCAWYAPSSPPPPPRVACPPAPPPKPPPPLPPPPRAPPRPLRARQPPLLSPPPPPRALRRERAFGGVAAKVRRLRVCRRSRRLHLPRASSLRRRQFSAKCGVLPL